MKKKPQGDGYRPFTGLNSLAATAGLRLQKAPEPRPPKEEPPSVVEPETDDDMFRRAMDGTTRVTWRPAPVSSPEPLPPAGADPELEERRLMEAAIEGDPALTVQAHPEYIEGWTAPVGKRYLPKLRNGFYSIQGQIDLHGLSREEARLAVEGFVTRMCRERSCCVKIIHGRGFNSPNERAVLKESLQRWLSTRRMSRHVVAYASAPFNDGGVGAIYVLLRRMI